MRTLPPPDARPIPIRLNLVLAAGFLALQGGWLFCGEPWLAIPMLLITPAYWALAHEAIHGVLVPGWAWNKRLGRLMAIAHGAPFGVLRLAHLLHHRYSRTLDASETYDPATTRPWVAQCRHYATILGGLYGGEVLAGLLAWLPAGPRGRLLHFAVGDNDLARRLADHYRRPVERRETAIDAALALALYGAAFLAWGEAWPWFLASLWARAALISLFDNAYHYGSPLGGDLADVRNHRLPAWLAPAVLNFNWHGVYHQAPSLPWIWLPAQAEATGARPSASYFGGALRQLAGAIPLGDARLRRRQTRAD